jgi:hypothetical protein
MCRAGGVCSTARHFRVHPHFTMNVAQEGGAGTMVRPVGRVPVGRFTSVAILRRFRQRVLFLSRIDEETPGHTATAGRDTSRKQVTSYKDGSFGVGWQVMQYGVLRKGYLAPVEIQVALIDAARREEWTDAGISLYEGPVVLYAPPVDMAKGDVLIEVTLRQGSPQPFARRWRVGDLLTPEQVLGTTILAAAKLEAPSPTDVIYQIPVT